MIKSVGVYEKLTLVHYADMKWLLEFIKVYLLEYSLSPLFHNTAFRFPDSGV